jgi:hypothetical protein
VTFRNSLGSKLREKQGRKRGGVSVTNTWCHSEQNYVSVNPRTLSFPPSQEAHLGWPCLHATLSTCRPHRMLLDVLEGAGRTVTRQHIIILCVSPAVEAGGGKRLCRIVTIPKHRVTGHPANQTLRGHGRERSRVGKESGRELRGTKNGETS